jgi:hypothetical protein
MKVTMKFFIFYVKVTQTGEQVSEVPFEELNKGQKMFWQNAVLPYIKN